MVQNKFYIIPYSIFIPYISPGQNTQVQSDCSFLKLVARKVCKTFMAETNIKTLTPRDVSNTVESV